ncbi:hypothetical protein HAX54_049428 [Datura stramonium]|uniref:NAC domain-containing protein n=1 Tax=Datura stramonium TaxID=4076 RepID=A0ABS8SVN3_DATST|nr:hypothetical protein [Datura stramonium]
MNNSTSTGMGFRFRPVDDELISYLIKFVSGNSFEYHHIRLLDLYGNKKPSDVFHHLSPDWESTDVNYLFTQLKKKSAQGKNVNRLRGGGTWKGLDAAKKIVSKKGSVIGFKKNFRFYDHEDGSNLGHDQRVVWTMKEYRLSDSIVKSLRGRNQIRHEDLVLCRVKRKVVRSKDQKHVINNCDDQEIGENNIVASDHNEQAMLGLGGYVGADGQDHEIVYTYSTVPISNSEEGFCDTVNVGGGNDQMMNGFCATSGYCLEDYQNYHHIEYSAPTSCNLEDGYYGGYNEFELREVDEQEFERAKATVPLLEESLSELSNILLQGSDDNDQYYNLLRGLAPITYI